MSVDAALRRGTVLIATDLDGTLVPEGSTSVPEFTARVLRRLDAAGLPVVFVTGRPLRAMDGLWAHVGTHGVAIVSNGALSFDAHTREIIALEGIDPREGFGICAGISTAIPGARFAIECADGIRLDPRYESASPSADAPRGELTEIWTEPAVKLLVRHPDIAPDLLHSRVAAAVGDRATVTWSVSGLVEISAVGVTKASALRRLCERMDVAAAEVVAFGDMPNDIPMLTWAGTAYAVANAHESVRGIADRVIPGCAEEGVARMLEELLNDHRGDGIADGVEDG